jgi:hypothetical protein
MSRGAKGYLIAVCVLLSVTCLVSGVRWLWITRDGNCICTQPREIVAGKIWSASLFEPPLYELGYRGSYQASGRECQTYLRVTEAEYSRKMYREDP